MYTHKSLSEDDLDAICRFPQTVEELFFAGPQFVFPLTPEQIMNVVADRFGPTVIIEEQSGQAVAYANLYNKNDDTCWLGNVMVAPEFRGKGAAEVLLNTMLHKASQNFGISKLALMCHNTNARGLAFYHKHGFRPVDLKITKLGEERKVIAIQMEKIIE